MCKICYIKAPNANNALFAASAMGFRSKYWPNGSTLTVSILGASTEQIEFFMEACHQWEKYANIKFVYQLDWHNADIRVQLNPQGGSWSYVGTDNTLISKGGPTMNLGWLDEDMRNKDLSTVLHEIGHAIGLGHEHQNPDQPFNWIRENVIKDLSGAPNNWSIEQIESNVLKQVPIDQVDSTVLDRHSIMMYFFPDSWVRNGRGSRQNKTLSKLDKQFISLIYPKQKEEKVIKYIKELLYSSYRIRRLTKKQLRVTIVAMGGSYALNDRRSDLRRNIQKLLA